MLTCAELHSEGSLITLPGNIRQGCKWSVVSNTTAYYNTESITAVNYVNFFSIFSIFWKIVMTKICQISSQDFVEKVNFTKPFWFVSKLECLFPLDPTKLPCKLSMWACNHYWRGRLRTVKVVLNKVGHLLVYKQHKRGWEPQDLI